MKVITIIFASISFFLGCMTTSYSQEYKCYPKNEVSLDSSLVLFTHNLKKAIDSKNSDLLISLIDTDIKFSFGEEHGIEMFNQYWNLENPTSEFWIISNRIVQMGGVFTNSFSDSDFVFPYTFSYNSPDSLIFTIGFIVNDSTSIYSKASFSSNIIARLDYDVVNVDYEKSILQKPSKTESYSWYYVNDLDSKKEGFVHSANLYCLLDYRMTICKENGIWRIKAFLNGD